jgi:hypothetical protein
MKRITVSLLAIGAACAAPAARAGIVNGSFESGLAGWNTFGDAAAVSGELVLTTASARFDDDAPAPAGAFNVSGNDAAPAGGSLETFVGVAPGALDPDPVDAVQAFEGSAAGQGFLAQAGSVLSFRWNLTSLDALPGDYAFVVIDGQMTRFAWGPQPGDGEFSATFSSGGMHQLAFGVVDVGDFNGTSALRVDSVQVSAVPEPASVLLMLAGLGAIALTRRRPQPGCNPGSEPPRFTSPAPAP